MWQMRPKDAIRDGWYVTMMTKFSLCSTNKKKVKSHHFESNFGLFLFQGT